MELFLGLKAVVIILIITIVLGMVLIYRGRRPFKDMRSTLHEEHATTMYLCGESEETIFRKASYDLTSMLISILGLERIKIWDIRKLDSALLFMVAVLSISALLVMLWISLRSW